MKKQYRIINKGKGVLKITPSNLNEVEQPLTEIEALYDYVNNQDGEVLLNSKAYTDNQITIVDDAITILGKSISTVNQNLTTKIEQLDESVDTRIALLDEAVDTRLSSLNENLITKIDDAVYDITEVVLPLKENKNEKGIANGYVPLNEFTKIALQYLNVVNNLVDGGTNSLLTAEQGKQLQLQVSAIQNILFSDNVNLDTVQEIVDALETVQSYIDTILVNDLITGGITKALTAEMGKVLKGLIDNLVTNKEDKINKQNSLDADATNNKYPTVTAVIAGLALKEPSFSKNTAFNKNFGTTAGTVAEGNHLHSFSDLQNNPTTIAGYGITDANKSPINVNVTTVRTTAAKIGTTSSGTYTPSIGDRIDVTFTLGTAIANATLNIDGSGVKAIQLAGTNVTALSLSTPASLVVIPMYYNGTAWQIYGSTMSADTNTTYIEATTGLVVTTPTQVVAVNTLYYANNASNVAFTLPTTCAVNSIVHIVGINSTGTYRVIAPSGDNIILEGNNTGAGGILDGSIGSTLVLRCTVANTTWSVVNYTGQIVSNTGYSTNKESTVNKSDSYSVSSTVTYPNTKALVDGLNLKANLNHPGLIGNVKTTGDQGVSGEKFFSDVINFTKTTIAARYEGPINLNINTLTSSVYAGAAVIGALNGSFAFASGSYGRAIFSTVNIGNTARTFTLPDKNGTVAMISDIPVALSGNYTPIVTINSNLSALSTSGAVWTRVDKIVTVTVSIDFTGTTANTQTGFSISVPIPMHLQNTVALRNLGMATFIAPFVPAICANVQEGFPNVNINFFIESVSNSYTGAVTFSYILP